MAFQLQRGTQRLRWVKRTAAALGISMKTLYNRLRNYNRQRSATDALESGAGDLPDTETQAADT